MVKYILLCNLFQVILPVLLLIVAEIKTRLSMTRGSPS